MSGTDILDQAEKHEWWHSDQGMAFNLIHEVRELRKANQRLQLQVRAGRAFLESAERELKRLRAVTTKEPESE